MTLHEAKTTLSDGGPMPQLVRAVATVLQDPASTPDDLLPALKHRGLVAEQAAIGLYRRTGQALPDDPAKLCVDPAYWAAELHPSVR